MCCLGIMSEKLMKLQLQLSASEKRFAEEVQKKLKVPVPPPVEEDDEETMVDDAEETAEETADENAAANGETETQNMDVDEATASEAKHDTPEGEELFLGGEQPPAEEKKVPVVAPLSEVAQLRSEFEAFCKNVEDKVSKSDPVWKKLHAFAVEQALEAAQAPRKKTKKTKQSNLSAAVFGAPVVDTVARSEIATLRQHMSVMAAILLAREEERDDRPVYPVGQRPGGVCAVIECGATHRLVNGVMEPLHKRATACCKRCWLRVKRENKDLAALAKESENDE